MFHSWPSDWLLARWHHYDIFLPLLAVFHQLQLEAPDIRVCFPNPNIGVRCRVPALEAYWLQMGGSAMQLRCTRLEQFVLEHGHLPRCSLTHSLTHQLPIITDTTNQALYGRPNDFAVRQSTSLNSPGKAPLFTFDATFSSLGLP